MEKENIKGLPYKMSMFSSTFLLQLSLNKYLHKPSIQTQLIEKAIKTDFTFFSLSLLSARK